MGRALTFSAFENDVNLTADVAVRRWLTCVIALLLLMITIGGATRLTGSGLSITEWQPIMGAVPPLTEAAWLEAFAKYKAIPQYVLVNKGMSLDAFKTIFWWEWAHRFLGRLIGLAYALPLLWFWSRGQLRPAFKAPLAALLVLGGLQGFIGWFMVQSGLSERVDVSQYRLALHLGMAFALLGGLVWMACSLGERQTRDAAVSRGQAMIAGVIVALLFLQIVAGAFVAGLKAGLTYNTWPLMDGRWVPAGLGTLQPWYLNLFENVTTVQFNHRVLAYGLAAIVLWHGLTLIRASHRRRNLTSAMLLVAALMAQIVLGIATLLWVVPLPLALAHQGFAAVLFATAVRHWHVQCYG
jgi:heme a synthase